MKIKKGNLAMTIKQILKKDDISLNDKKIILSYILNIKPTQLVLINEIKPIHYLKYKYYLIKLIKGKPLQYVLKNTNFYGYDFYVNKNVLIPRPETEYLVEYLSEYIKDDHLSVLDLGTGSGCIAITLKKLYPSLDIYASDISKKALNIAKNNAKKHNVDINFIKSDLFNNINKSFDIIISNPPYIDIDENIEDIVKNNEPHIALYAKDKGLYFYKEILKRKAKLFAFEIGSNQKDKILGIINAYYPKAKVITKKDLNNLDRYIYVISK